MSDPETRARVSQKRKKKLADKYRRLDSDGRSGTQKTPSNKSSSYTGGTNPMDVFDGEGEDLDLYPYADTEQGYPYDFDFEYWRRKYDLPDEELD